MFKVSSINTSSRGKRSCGSAQSKFFFVRIHMSNLDRTLKVEVSPNMTVNFDAVGQHALDQTFDVVERRRVGIRFTAWAWAIIDCQLKFWSILTLASYRGLSCTRLG